MKAPSKAGTKTPTSPAVCSACGKTGTFIRTRKLMNHNASVWLCETNKCPKSGLYWHTFEWRLPDQNAIAAYYLIEKARELLVPVKTPTTSGAELIRAERIRQVSVEGWTVAHDDKYRNFELTLAAISYAEVVVNPDNYAKKHGLPPGANIEWPWAQKWWRPSDDPIRNLVKAGALIAAEIDRLQRLRGR